MKILENFLHLFRVNAGNFFWAATLKLNGLQPTHRGDVLLWEGAAKRRGHTFTQSGIFKVQPAVLGYTFQSSTVQLNLLAVAANDRG